MDVREAGREAGQEAEQVVLEGGGTWRKQRAMGVRARHGAGREAEREARPWMCMQAMDVRAGRASVRRPWMCAGRGDACYRQEGLCVCWAAGAGTGKMGGGGPHVTLWLK